MSGNYKQLSRDIKVRILTLSREGLSCRQIAERIGCSHSTVSRLLQKKENSDPLERKKGTGPKKITTDKDDRILRRISLQDRFKTSAEISRELRETHNINISSATVRRRLCDIGLFGRRPAKKPLLTGKMKAARLEWAKKYRTWTVEDWRRVIWSDESKFNLFGSDASPYVRRKRGERYAENCTLSTVKHTESQMLWACFSYHFLGRLYFIDGTVNAQLYVQIIRETLVPSIEEHLSFTNEIVFQGDSAPCHRAASVKNVLDDLGIQRLDWPGNSPDLNPIENLWSILKRKVASERPKTKKELTLILENTWYNNIASEIIRTLVDSMPDRIKAVIKARGGPTKY